VKRLEVLITVKTYPVPSSKYDELVCTAGVTRDGDFVRLYPINFRDLPWGQQYKKYQWISVAARKHQRDPRKESYRPDCDTLKLLGEPIPPKRGDWTERAQFVLRNEARSLEELQERHAMDQTSVGIFKPKQVSDLVFSPEDPNWKPSQLEELRQARLWEYRENTKEPPRKLPYKFQYRFECNDSRCRCNHKIMIADWELGALFWKLRDQGACEEEAAQAVRSKFFDELCGADRDTRFFVGTTLAHQNSWIILGLFPPKKGSASERQAWLPGFDTGTA